MNSAVNSWRNARSAGGGSRIEVARPSRFGEPRNRSQDDLLTRWDTRYRVFTSRIRQNRAKIAYHDSATGLPQAHRKRFIDAQPGYEFPRTGVISRNRSAIVAAEFKGSGKAILPKRSRERILDGQEKQS
jgi:hypothetical protein